MTKKKRWTYKDRRPWWKPKPCNPEKRVKLFPHEIIAGPRELTVVWDDGKRFRKEVGKLFTAFKNARSKETRRILWDIIIEGAYSWYPKVAKRKFSTSQQKKACVAVRKKWQSKRLSGLHRLKKSAYGFLPPSESFSTIPT